MPCENDLSFWDKPEILEVIFPLVYSPFSFAASPAGALRNACNHFIEVERGIKIGCAFWAQGRECPSLLYFHGNGEEASDHDWIAPLYNKRGINLFVADYRGYGLSDGRPTISSMIRDSHLIFQGFKKVLDEEYYLPSLFLMGRSLGSVSAIEVALHHQESFNGLIIESGSANNFRRLWEYLDAAEKERGLREECLNRGKIKKIHIPTCIIHGEYDQILPVEEGKELYENSGASNKELLIVPGADHNDLMLRGQKEYFDTIESFISRNSSA
ncbi:MAG: alpha/beta hydrolase [Dehalococcoidia bacterium]|nr:alpha/beta hydrolase [Dehalococcoidia bacterium]